MSNAGLLGINQMLTDFVKGWCRDNIRREKDGTTLCMARTEHVGKRYGSRESEVQVVTVC